MTSSNTVAETTFGEILQFDSEREHSYVIERADAPFASGQVEIGARRVRGRRRYLGLEKEDRAYLK